MTEMINMRSVFWLSLSEAAAEDLAYRAKDTGNVGQSQLSPGIRRRRDSTPAGQASSVPRDLEWIAQYSAAARH